MRNVGYFGYRGYTFEHPREISDSDEFIERHKREYYDLASRHDITVHEYVECQLRSYESTWNAHW